MLKQKAVALLLVVAMACRRAGFIVVAAAQSCSDFVEVPLPSLDSTASLDAIVLGTSCEGMEDGEYTVLENVHWKVSHNGAEDTVRFWASHQDLLVPVLDSASNKLSFRYGPFITNRTLESSSAKAAGVEITAPSEMLQQIQVQGVANVVEIQALNNGTTTTISVDGVANAVTYSGESGSVVYQSNGVGCAATLLVTSSGEAEIRLAGVDQSVRVSAPQVTATSSGVSNALDVVAGSADIFISGTDSLVRVDGGTTCDSYRSDGLNNQCMEASVQVTISELDCLSDGGTSTSTVNCAAMGSDSASSAGLLLSKLLFGGTILVLLAQNL